MNYTDYVKSQVTAKDWEILQQLNVNLDSKMAARLWPEAVNLELRVKMEIPFLLSQLQEYHSPRIFDACIGSGSTSIGLTKAGIDKIFSNEIDPEFQHIAREESARQGVQLDIVAYDWQKLSQHYQQEFDAVVCLGNSLTYLFKKEDQMQAIYNFRNILDCGGKLILDERNYRQILQGKFKHSGKMLYCGKDRVSIQPIYTSPSMVVLEYSHRQRDEKTHLVVYPFKEGEMQELFLDIGFNHIKVFGDYQKQFNPEDVEFFTYVAQK